MKKKIAVLLMLALLLPCLLAFSSAAGTAEDGGGKLRVSGANIQFASTVYLLIAVDYTEVYEDAAAAMGAVSVTVTDKAGKETVLLPDAEVMQTDGFPEGALGFRFTDLGAKNMGDELSIVAEDGEHDSDPKIFSVLEYAVKARITYADNEVFCDAMKAMLEFGAEAQRAFGYTGDYMLYDESGYLDYGLVRIYGGERSEYLAAIGSSLAPAASEAIGANPVLYDTAYGKVANNAVTVKAGLQSYFFVGDGTRTAINLDMNTYTGESTGQVHVYYDTEAKVKVNGLCYFYTLPDGTVTLQRPSGTAGVDYSALLANSVCAATAIDGGFHIVEPGALTVVGGEQAGYNFNLGASEMPQNLADRYTVTVSVKCPSGLTSMGGGNVSISSISFDGRIRNGGTWCYLWQVKGGEFYLGGQTSGIALGAVSKTEFTTFHVVVDVLAGTYTGYDAAGNCLGSCAADINTGGKYATDYNSDITSFLQSSGKYINWSMSATNNTRNTGVVLNRFTITNGNIFD